MKVRVIDRQALGSRGVVERAVGGDEGDDSRLVFLNRIDA
jgi:hypothetical protein